MMRLSVLIKTIVLFLSGTMIVNARIIDTLQFGGRASEEAHGLITQNSVAADGGLGEPSRRILPLAPNSWEGGRIAFTLKVDSEKQNYVTVRLWGSDVNNNRLYLYCAGRQLGYRHLGDIDILDSGSDEPAYNGRFFYNTSPLPMTLTKGKDRIELEIRSGGPIWGYGTNFDQYQKPMTEPSRGIYNLYTHTDGCFEPPANEKQGAVPVPAVRQSPGAEVLEQLKDKVNREVKKLLEPGRLSNQMQIQFLARAYHVKWTAAFQQELAVKQIAAGLDRLYAAYLKSPELAARDPATPNPGWFGFGPAGEAVQLLHEQLSPYLDSYAGDGDGKKLTRREAWTRMLLDGQKWLRTNRRQYTNQTMIIDMNIYQSNRGIAALSPAAAMPEPQALRFLYEAVGLEPWLGSEIPGGFAMPLGGNYYQLTAKGLTRELGYVGYYGEVLDWVTQIYDATRPAPGLPGDAAIKAQLEKIIHARAVFRYPAPDADGCRAMRIETITGWRDTHYPGNVTYAERPTWDASALYAPAATLDSGSSGSVRQMFEDNQFFQSVKKQNADGRFRVTVGQLHTPDQYETLKALPGGARLPMSAGQPDFVWSDEEDGVVAVKSGDEILYASLYWRARYGINFLARIHYIKPQYDRIAVVKQETEFEPDGRFYIRPDWTNFGFGNGGIRYPEKLHSVHAGEKLPIAKIPAGIKFKPGDENIYAGRGTFYKLRYGSYLIGMNCSASGTFKLELPPEWKSARLLTGGRTDPSGRSITIAPLSTAVFKAE